MADSLVPHKALNSGCTSCHNPHASYAATATAPKGSGKVAGVWGISSSGALVRPSGTPSSVNEYEICYKCHSSFAWGTGAPPTGSPPPGHVDPPSGSRPPHGTPPTGTPPTGTPPPKHGHMGMPGGAPSNGPGM